MRGQGFALTLVLSLGLAACSPAPRQPALDRDRSLDSLTGDPIEIEAMEAKITGIMEMTSVPGLSLAIIINGQKARPAR